MPDKKNFFATVFGDESFYTFSLKILYLLDGALN